MRGVHGGNHCYETSQEIYSSPPESDESLDGRESYMALLKWLGLLGYVKVFAMRDIGL